MQSREPPALSLTQQIGLTICSILQLLILSTAALLKTLLRGRSSKTGVWSWIYLCALFGLVVAGLVVGVVLVVATWCGLGEHSVEYWADCELSVMLLWSMLLESIVLAGLIVTAFGRTYAQGVVMKSFLLALSLTGIGLLSADFQLRWSSRLLPTLAVAAFRGSMMLSCFIVRLEGVRRGTEAKSQNRKLWLPLDIRSCFEIGTFGLSFLSFYDILASRINYKLVQNGMFTVIGIVNGITRFRRHRKRKSEKKETSRRQMAGEDTTDGVSLSNRSRTKTIPSDSKIELVSKEEDV